MKNVLLRLSIESLKTIKRWIAENADKLEAGEEINDGVIIRGENKQLYELDVQVKKYTEPEKIDGRVKN